MSDDVTERRSREQADELARARRRREAAFERLTEALRDREEMIAIVAHDLRSPASAIKLQFGLLRRELEREELDRETLVQLVEAADGSLDRMIELMTELLDGAVQGDGADHVELVPLDFGEALRRTMEGFNGDLADSDSELTVRIDDGLTGECDEVRFGQIATNLIANAVRYGEGNPIEISLTGDDEEVRLVVRDHGVGIAPDERDTIFGQYHRVGDEAGSYGLGLWIVKKAVDALGGAIEVESTLGDGSMFTVVLPRYPF